MTLALISLIILSAAELALWLPGVWRLRRALLCVLIPALALFSGLFFGEHMAIWTGCIFILSIYRLINLLRVLENRLQPKQLYRVSQRTSFWLIFGQAVAGSAAGLSVHYDVPALHWTYAAAIGQLLGAAVILASTVRHLRTTQPPVKIKSLSDKELPTVSVLIPARNETEDLEACLQSLVGSTYPKLEILVLDDCSQNKHTPEIIKGYAHVGVRFIAGKTPPKHWLAKNYAYQQLVEEANGELLLFCGVDSRFEPDSLRVMVETMAAKHKQMISLIPKNEPPKHWSPEALFIQPSRYAWELSLPRRLFRRPAVLSTCWLITAEELHHAGGFPATANSVSAESFFARHAIGHDDGYSFLRSDARIGLGSAKSLAEQRATAIRVRYPQLHRRPELVALVSLALFGCLIAPFGLLITTVCLGLPWPLIAICALSSLLLARSFVLVTSLTYRRFKATSPLTLPFAALYDIGLLNYSLWRYEFREVIWKGRNICMPILQNVPEQPSTAN
jgi:glycosyltransferase involved in cell wall biosynthesis